MRPVYWMLALPVAGIAALTGELAQTNRASENISVLRARKIELVAARGVARARLSTEAGGEVVLR